MPTPSSITSSCIFRLTVDLFSLLNKDLTFFPAGEDEDLRGPQNGQSDSDFYCKGRNEEIRESEYKQEQSLGEEKYFFIQRYLERAHDTYSVGTFSGESGFVTEGTASEAGHLEDRAGKY